MTFAQKRFPNVPSRCLEFRGQQRGLYPVSHEGNEEVIAQLERDEKVDPSGETGAPRPVQGSGDEDEAV
jgi:pre-mRNA-splicing factor 18